MSEMDVSADFGANIERFTGFAGDYDRFRPAPETKLADLLLQIAGNPSITLSHSGSGLGYGSCNQVLGQIWQGGHRHRA